MSLRQAKRRCIKLPIKAAYYQPSNCVVGLVVGRDAAFQIRCPALHENLLGQHGIKIAPICERSNYASSGTLIGLSMRLFSSFSRAINTFQRRTSALQ